MKQKHKDTILRVSGLNYHLNEWDGGGSTTVLFLHGYLDLGQSWSFLAESLSDTDWYLVAPDWRGHGDTQWIGAGGYYHFPDYVRDLEQIVRHTRREKVVLVGHSMGAMVATLWAGSTTQSLDGLVLVDGTGPMPVSAVDYPSRFNRFLEQTAPYEPDAHARPMDDMAHVERRLSRIFPKLSSDMIQRIAQFSTRPLDGGKREWKYDPLHKTRSPMPMLPDIVTEFWRRVRCPTLWVGGEESPWNLPQVHEWLDINLHLERRVVSGVGHAVHHEGVGELARDLIQFFKQHDLG